MRELPRQANLFLFGISGVCRNVPTRGGLILLEGRCTFFRVHRKPAGFRGCQGMDRMIKFRTHKGKRFVKWAGVSLLIGCIVWVFLTVAHAEPVGNIREDGSQDAGFSGQFQKVPVHLYFADRNNAFLKSEQRILLQPGNPLHFGRAIVEALIKGPQKGLLRTLPADTKLNAIYLTAAHVCYVDLSAAVRENHPGGSNSELLTIYSVVNSLVLNISEIERVKILIDGHETPTLAGHIDLQFPVKAHMLIIR
jgi:hypothetical protein